MLVELFKVIFVMCWLFGGIYMVARGVLTFDGVAVLAGCAMYYTGCQFK